MKNKGFTPLEKATDEVSGEKNIDADGSLMPPSAETVSPIKNNISNGIKGRSSLTGFTLIELMLVVIIIGTLAALVVPRLAGRAEKARVTAAKADILSNMPLALDLFEMDNGSFPTTQQGLSALVEKPTTPPLPANWNGPYLKRKPVDPWGNAYQYVSPGIHNRDDYDLYSYGKDGTEGGDDDITNWEE